MNKNLKIAAVVVLLGGLLLGGLAFWNLKYRSRNRGHDLERSTIETELRNLYNYPGERVVIVSSEKSKLTLTFVEDKMKEVRRSFYNRHKDDFRRFYEAGFDTLIVEAKRDGGETARIQFDLTRYRYQ